MSRSILVMNSGSVQDQAFADPSAVDEGVLAAFTADGTLLQLDDGADGDTIQDVLSAQDTMLVIGGGAGNAPLRQTALLKASNFVSAEKKAYTAPVKQVTDVTPIVGTAGVAAVKVADVTTGYQPFPKITADVKITAAENAEAVVDKLVAAINAIKRAPVVASKTGTGASAKLRLTAKDFNTSFVTSVDETQAGAVVASVSAPSQGSGTYAQVRDMEFRNRAAMTGEYYVQDGILGDREGGAPSASLAGLAASGTNYNIYAVRYLNDQEDSINRAFKYHEVLLCIGTGVTGDLDAFAA
jgi:hypothetical protein